MSTVIPLRWRVWFISVALFGAATSKGAEQRFSDVPALEFTDLSQGAVATAGVGTSLVGDTLMLEVGAQSLGLRSLNTRRWLIQWDAFLGTKGGYLVHELPATLLAGGRFSGLGEVGYRLEPFDLWSAYVGARVDGTVQVMASPGMPLSTFRALNNVDGVGGVTANGGLRLGVGASRLTDRCSWVFVAFVQESIQAPELHASRAAYAEGGASIRLDIAHAFSASIEAFAGSPPSTTNATLHLTDQTFHEEMGVVARRTFDHGMWLGVDARLSRDSNHAVYSQTGSSYDTANPPTFGLTFVLGVPLGELP